MNRRWSVLLGAGVVALLVLAAPEPAASTHAAAAAMQRCGGLTCP